MDRDRLRRWLESPHRTFRWNVGERSYDGVATTDEGLRWFRWSHEFGIDGEHDAELQSWDEFRDRGPSRALPEPIRAELAEWIARHRPVV